LQVKLVVAVEHRLGQSFPHELPCWV
jgi:hypothetical protein